ncbi:hypothetical protein AB0K92_28765 [Streptomyces sp. NPDC052687]|uniref:hypothetical protein n=1 Tax=Streptomyces sp. NPDC052687 TaxID=3154759 RepID=UPI003418B080
MLLHLPTRQLTPRHFLSTDRAPAGWGAPADHPGTMRHSLRSFLPTAVVGRYYGEGQTLPNGDFTSGHRSLLAGDLDRIERARPAPR